MSNAANGKKSRIRSILPFVGGIAVTLLGLLVVNLIGAYWHRPGWFSALCHDYPWIGGLLAFGAATVLFRLASGHWNVFELARGQDERPSSSKLQFLLWTASVLFAYATLVFAKLGNPAIADKGINLPVNLLLVMGFSITTALGAKAITVAAIKNDDIVKNKPTAETPSGTSDVVKDDAGTLDLTKFQMLAWTVIGIVTFFVSLTRFLLLGAWTSGNPPQGYINLPDVDQALMVLMGFGHGTYLGKKLIIATNPTVAKMVPEKVRGGTIVEITGTNFGNTTTNNQITWDGIPIKQLDVKAWTDASIKFVFPYSGGTAYTWGRIVNLGVIVAGEDSNTASVQLSQPMIAQLEITGNEYKLKGECLGGQGPGDAVQINGHAATLGTWDNESVSFSNPAIATNLTEVSVILRVDGNDVPFNSVQIKRTS